MAQSAPEDALSYCARIRDLVLHHSGGWADADALRKFKLLSYAAARASGDGACAEIMHTAEQYATDLFSATAHHNWARRSTSGADMLRLCILGRLDAFRDRVIELQAARRGLDGAAADAMLYPKDE
jgi:hypothetical protein